MGSNVFVKGIDITYQTNVFYRFENNNFKPFYTEMIDSERSEVASLCHKNKKYDFSLKYNNHNKHEQT